MNNYPFETALVIRAEIYARLNIFQHLSVSFASLWLMVRWFLCDHWTWYLKTVLSYLHVLFRYHGKDLDKRSRLVQLSQNWINTLALTKDFVLKAHVAREHSIMFIWYLVSSNKFHFLICHLAYFRLYQHIYSFPGNGPRIVARLFTAVPCVSFLFILLSFCLCYCLLSRRCAGVLSWVFLFT